MPPHNEMMGDMVAEWGHPLHSSSILKNVILQISFLSISKNAEPKPNYTPGMARQPHSVPLISTEGDNFLVTSQARVGAY